MPPFDFLRRTCTFSAAGLLLLYSAVSAADDTEIFFGTQPSSNIRPNVLFILDDSGSMGWCVNSNADTCSTDNRMKALKDTMVNLLSTTSGVNAGLMVLNNSAKTAGDASVPRLLQAVDNIDAPFNVKIASPEIKISADDASRDNGSNNIADPSLVMGYISDPGSPIIRSLGAPNVYSNDNSTYYLRTSGGSTYTCSVQMDATSECPDGTITTLNSGSSGQNGLLLFRNLNIPKGVTITSAILELDSSATSSTINISLVNSKTPSAFNHSSPLSSTFTANSPKTSSVVGTTHQINITDLLQAQQDLAPSLNPIGDLAVRLSSTRTTFSYAVGDVVNAPRLTITYTGSQNSDRTSGLRFQTVNVPQGATITRAILNFVPASSDDRTVSFSVTAENIDDASDFSGADFTARAKTGAMPWTPAPWRTENPPVHTENGANVTTQVQEVVNRSGWCGNNAMAFFLTPSGGNGSRTAVSQDGNDGFKPVLSISYTGGDTGCIRPIADLSLIQDKDDARQYSTGGRRPNTVAVTLGDDPLPFGDTYTYLGARFQQVPFRNGATVDAARLIVTPSSAKDTTATVEVYFDNTDNSAAFSASDNNLGQRSPSTKTNCTFTSQGPGIPVYCETADLKSALQSILRRSGWKDGNALSILLKQTSASSSLKVGAYETSAASAIRLQVKLHNASDLTDNTYKVRDYLKGAVSDMQANSGTPLVDLLYQAGSYYTALPGKHKGPTSPIEDSCQANYLVLMTDGQANGNTSTIVSNAQGLIGSSCTARGTQGNNETAKSETCGVEIAKWLHDTDQSSTLENVNRVTTHTVGFALQSNATAEKFLADVAKAGGGTPYTANNASQLANAFSDILREALATNTTFVSATAPVNSFNRQDHKDQLYFSLFSPSLKDRWAGNLKRYRMDIQNGLPLILDKDNKAAIDAKTGFFNSNALSWWSTAQDGSNVTLGGAASRLKTPADRNLWSNIAGDTALSRLDSSLTATQIGAANNTERDTLINYIRGYETGSTVERKAVGDPIHSTPSLVTYGCTTTDSDGNCTKEIQSAIIGTNEGFVQIFDTNNGDEQFAFMPQELLGNIKRLAANAVTGNNSHVYGMDNSVTVWAEDTDKNGAINDSEFVYAYASMGRGGRSLYALDITNPASSTLKWIIKGGSGDFTRLGQTWSAPVRTKIKVGTTITDVLIFGGGYDENQDPKTTQNNVRRYDSQGNDLFIVNAKTGALLWSASSAGINMRYSVPSKVSVIGLETNAANQPIINKDGLTTQIFVGDMGGQVWRFLINNGSSGSSLASGQIFASIAGDDEASARRFYNEPAISLLGVNNKINLTVSLGSGYRGHPLDKVIQDRFYSFRTEKLNSHDTTRQTSDLYNATSLLKVETTAEKAEQKALLAKQGWYINLASNGEKVLTSTMAIGGDLYFNTFQPVATQNSCHPTPGTSRGYRVNLLDGTAVSDTRYSTLVGATLPSNPQVYCKGDTCWAYNDPSQLIAPPKLPCSGPDCSTPPKSYDMASKSRLYWTDKYEE